MLSGLFIQGYRSFSSKGTWIKDLSKVNVFLGKNNCGKSNVLRFVKFLADINRKGKQNEDTKPDDLLDYCREDTSRKIKFGLQIKEGIFSEKGDSSQKQLLAVFTKSEQPVWFYFDICNECKPNQESIELIRNTILENYDIYGIDNLARSFFGRTAGGKEQGAAEIAQRLHTMVDFDFKVNRIDAFRKISQEGDDSLSGSGLIEELRNLKAPDLPNIDKGRTRFEKIVSFLKEILGETTADIEIPARKDEIYVSIRGKILPLESLGTGIHELIIMAAAVTLFDEQIFCIEEPEIHLHPELQKKFIRYILDKTNNQYLIASHSNAFFDQPGINIYRCQLDASNCTNCDLVSTASEKHEILVDLGYRPSDLLQANYIIWVEGPSDRIYLNHWIHAKAPELVEGLHYAIMFYGGRLLAHLAYDDPLVKEFIQLSCLNRNACIVMDSDRQKTHGQINKTKQRIRNDFESKGCHVWITKGRTIENYIPEQLFNDAIAAVHPRTKHHIHWKQFADMTHLREDKIIDKVSVARKITEHGAEFSMLDLDKTMDLIFKHIRQHNSQNIS